MPNLKNPNIISPKEAGAMIGCGQDLVRYALRTGQFPVGVAFKNGENGQWQYIIPREAYMDWLNNYHKTMPIRLFDRWLTSDGTYIIPKKELKMMMLGYVEYEESAAG